MMYLLSYETSSGINAKIVLDDIESVPILDFSKYVESLHNIIRNSDPNFSIGIYGEWGTGKTTLMKSIESKINETEKDSRKIIPVWFNAWRYEREEHLATVPLLKTIAYTLNNYSGFEEMSSKILSSLKVLGKEVLSMGLSRLFNNEVNIEDIIKKMKQANSELHLQYDKDTILYDGLNEIRDSIAVKVEEGYRIVVFIDDLDRCSHKKTLEVFESIKAFLDIPGFIFVIGLSFYTTSKLITDYYKDKVKGEDYIKKIIQVPIFIQEWNSEDIVELIHNISKNLVSPYNSIFAKNEDGKDHMEILKIALEKNPREVKRFINTYIISNEIYSESTEHTTLLQVQCLKWRWRDIYDIFSMNEKFRTEIKQLVGNDHEERISKFEELFTGIKKSGHSAKITEGFGISLPSKKVDRELNKFKNVFESILDDDDFWTFLKNTESLWNLKSKEDWNLYRRASAASDEKKISDENRTKTASELLTECSHCGEEYRKDLYDGCPVCDDDPIGEFYRNGVGWGD